MLEYLLPSIPVEITLCDAFIPACLRVRLPNVLGIGGIGDLTVESLWSENYAQASVIALSIRGGYIYRLLSNCSEVEVNAFDIPVPVPQHPSIITKYLVPGCKRPPRREEIDSNTRLRYLGIRC